MWISLWLTKHRLIVLQYRLVSVEWFVYSDFTRFLLFYGDRRNIVGNVRLNFDWIPVRGSVETKTAFNNYGEYSIVEKLSFHPVPGADRQRFPNSNAVHCKIPAARYSSRDKSLTKGTVIGYTQVWNSEFRRRVRRGKAINEYCVIRAGWARCTSAGGTTLSRRKRSNGRIAAYSLTGERHVVRTVFWTRNTVSRFWFSPPPPRWPERIELFQVDFPAKRPFLPRFRPWRSKLDPARTYADGRKKANENARQNRSVRPEQYGRENILLSFHIPHYRETLRTITW